jgi:hypothetical protein
MGLGETEVCVFMCVLLVRGVHPEKRLHTYTNHYYFHKLDSEDREPQQEKKQQQENQQQQKQREPHSQLQQQQKKQQKTQHPQQQPPPQPHKPPPQPKKQPPQPVYTWRDLADDDKIEKVWQKTVACALEKHRLRCKREKEESICADYKDMPDKKLGQSLRSEGYCVAPGTIDEEDSIVMANIMQKLQRWDHGFFPACAWLFLFSCTVSPAPGYYFFLLFACLS